MAVRHGSWPLIAGCSILQGSKPRISNRSPLRTFLKFIFLNPTPIKLNLVGLGYKLSRMYFERTPKGIMMLCLVKNHSSSRNTVCKYAGRHACIYLGKGLTFFLMPTYYFTNHPYHWLLVTQQMTKLSLVGIVTCLKLHTWVCVYILDLD